MKKIILGLFLTVGISGMALASSDKNEDKPKETTSPPENCVIITTIRNFDSCGKQIDTLVKATGGTGSECSGALDGLKTSSSSMTIEGCRSNLTGPQKPSLSID